jgi:hypothetical protein
LGARVWFVDPARKLPATAETVYRVGSVSKLFTDIGIMQLVERGELDLDAPITKYLPDFDPQNPFGAPITLRELMTHRAGLVQWMEYVPLKKISEDVWEFPEDSSYDHEKLTFLRDKSGCATRVKVGEVLFPRRPACTQLKLVGAAKTLRMCCNRGSARPGLVEGSLGFIKRNLGS